ncbi:MAG: transposase [Patescibacteria group bacterium]
MTSRNRIKQYVDESYYHIYNRGVAKRVIFKEKQDYAVFLNLLKRYLDDKPSFDQSGREYEYLHDRIELLAFCLMPNHYHLLIYAQEAAAMTRLLRGVATSYSTYFNKKYERIGPLFQDRFKASWILRDNYLLHISRYIHLNPKDWRTWEYSSLAYYLGMKDAAWVRPKRMLELFENKNYEQFVADYESQKQIWDELKHELADY